MEKPVEPRRFLRPFMWDVEVSSTRWRFRQQGRGISYQRRQVGLVEIAATA